MNNKTINDSLNFKDGLCGFEVPKQRHGFKTEIKLVDDYGDVLFEHEENQTVLGGALFAIEKIFDSQHTWKPSTLNELMSIANDGVPGDIKDNFVCLFGAGTGGCGDSPASVVDVKPQERELVNMIPFRLTNSPLDAESANKYWFSKTVTIGGNSYKAYYMKTIDMKTTKVLWKDGTDGEDGSEVSPDVWNSTRTEPIETFVELTLRISSKDFREFFEAQGNIEASRINTIGLFTGVKTLISPGNSEYKDVSLFSKYNFSNELLQLDKGMTFFYRVFVI